jgi:hypothetical protein
VGSLFGTFLSDVATDSSQRFFLASFRALPSPRASRPGPSVETIDFQRDAHTAPRLPPTNDSTRDPRKAPTARSSSFRIESVHPLPAQN